MTLNLELDEYSEKYTFRIEKQQTKISVEVSEMEILLLLIDLMHEFGIEPPEETEGFGDE